MHDRAPWLIMDGTAAPGAVAMSGPPQIIILAEMQNPRRSPDGGF
jgi:hypothetical protein